jgi:hypothetical protein
MDTNSAQIASLSKTETLRFTPIAIAHLPLVADFVALSGSLTCDYTIGGIYLWIKHFNYQLAVRHDVLYIRGGREDNLSVAAFSFPLGRRRLADAVAPLMDYCRELQQPLWLSAVPEDALHRFASLPGGCEVEPLGAEWSDYLYDLRQLAGLEGGQMKKKRNHVNRFMQENPAAVLTPLRLADVAECCALLHAVGHDDTPTGRSEFEAVEWMLQNWAEFAPYMLGGVLRTAPVDGEVVAFTIGEVKGFTLHVHVEKANHSYAGVGEAVTHLFARQMLLTHPYLLLTNRQDDAGDPGLRAAKQSWHPQRLLPKFNVRISD